MEKTGKNWKKMEETGRNKCKQWCKQTKCWKEVPRYCEVILEHQCMYYMYLYFSKFRNFAIKVSLTEVVVQCPGSNDCML